MQISKFYKILFNACVPKNSENHKKINDSFQLCFKTNYRNMQQKTLTKLKHVKQ